jgi:hypothetical protein
VRPHSLKLDTASSIILKQMAMVLVFQKPIRSNRKGEVAEGLPGSGKSAACVKRNTRELGRPKQLLRGQVGAADQKKGADDCLGVRSAHSTRRTGEPFTRGRG